MNNLERRLRRLEGIADSGDQFRFMIQDGVERPTAERLQKLGILDLPKRTFGVISVVIVHPGRQSDEPLPHNVSPYDSGNWRHEPVGLHGEPWDGEPILLNFRPAGGPVRPGSAWVKEF